jgi:hypothetical protein
MNDVCCCLQNIDELAAKSLDRPSALSIPSRPQLEASTQSNHFNYIELLLLSCSHSSPATYRILSSCQSCIHIKMVLEATMIV